MPDWFLYMMIAGLIWSVGLVLKRRLDNYERILRPELQRHGYRLNRIRRPRLFDTGPFNDPAIVWDRAFQTDRAPAGTGWDPGRHTQYRVVQFTAGGRVREIWAKLEFRNFKLRQVTWNPSLDSFQ